MADLSTGADSVGGERFGACEYNDIKNHWRMSDPCSNLANIQPGMIVSDSDDEKLYHYQAAACQEIIQTATPITDDAQIIGGDGSDAILIPYEETTNDAVIWGIPTDPKRGIIFCDVADIGANFTGLTTAMDVCLRIVDKDVDSILHVGFVADDIPHIDSNRDIRIQYEAQNDVTFFQNCGAGENRYVTIYGWSTGRGARQFTRFQMSDINDEFLIEAENNADHEGITISLTETNQRFRVRQNGDFISMYHDGAIAYINTSTTPLHLLPDVAQNIECWSGVGSGETPELKIHGFRAADANRSLEIGVGVDAANTVTFDGLDNYYFDGAIRVTKDIAFDAGEGGRIYKGATGGLALVGVTGTIYDFTVATPTGQSLIENPTGTASLLLVRGSGNVGIDQATFGTNAQNVFAQATGTAPTTSPANCYQQWSADVLGVAGKAGPHQRSEEGGMRAWHGGAGTLNNFTYQADVADDGTFNLPAITDSAWGFIQAGDNEEYAFFTIDDDGDVTLISNSANVVANADTDDKLCIGTAATQEPLVIRNRLDAEKNINLIIWYS